uniref:AraC family transcriptional regulator n=1 Tax=uncultured Draconibacterium sp. TaxID=1573823 RepID=UPI0032170E26
MHFFYSKTHPAASGSELIDEFEFINDFGFEEYKDIRQKPLSLHLNEGIEICYVTKGRYEWIVEGKKYTLLPGDGFVTCPWQKHGSPREVVDLGEIYWVVIKPDYFLSDGNFNAGNWSRLNRSESKLIGRILSGNENHKLLKAHFLKSFFVELKNELEQQGFGYRQRVSNLTEDFLIAVVRHIQNRENRNLKNQNWFSEFDLMLKADLSRKWTLDEMAQLENIGITTLTRLVKESTGYTPANYLIFLRLEKAKELLSTSSLKLTDIAYDCGFYSSQHFSSTFSKWIGRSPLNYRKMLKTS